MKKILSMILIAGALVSGFGVYTAKAGQMEILVDKLVEKGILTPYEAQIIVAEAKEEAARELAKGEAVTAPSWTQKIKIKGDVRYRNQVEWGKGLDPAHERIRNRVRARLGVEGQVNDEIDAGVLLVTGSTDPRSTNQTLDNNWQTQDIRLDQYYIDWHPALPSDIGTMDVWAGKFKNPFENTSLLWDGDICPGGIAMNYASSSFDLGNVPTTLFGNFGFLWIDELSTSQKDPLLFVFQGGTRMDVIEDWDATFGAYAAYYATSHIKNNDSYTSAAVVAGSGTNSYNADNTFKYGYDMVDVILKYDAKAIFDLKVGHGVYADLIWNTDPSKRNFAWMLGAYVGDKKPKDPGQWKAYFEWRHLEQDAVPDFMPDSDFYGYRSATGAPAGGGTNGEGPVCGIDYALFKNTVLSVKYYYTSPIDLDAGAYDQPYQLWQTDINVKF
ncbi:MAG: putative porin [Candidatus Omnitrophica bacterium]|nr:putative porin [Candidatus Omnitrophota bacterium]MDD5488614.1 putative porin [Candidatus Omnitrophota bacterium]